MPSGSDSRGAGRVRLCIDARLAGHGGTGVATYGDALVAAAAVAGWPPLRLRATHPAGGLAARVRRWVAAPRTPMLGLEAAAGDLLAADPFRLAHVRFRQTGRMLRLRAPGPPGIMHWTYPVPLLVEGWANLYTVHDAIPIDRPELTPIDRRRHRALLAAVTTAAARLVAVSEAGAGAVARATGCDRAQIVDCGQAVLPVTPATGPLPLGLARDGYLLFCGRIEPRKNLARLIAAWAAAGRPLPLVLAGPEGWRSGPILSAARAAGALVPGYLPRATLTALIEGARALLNPSLAEGFGLPLAEAMAAGTPALISRDPALLEVADGAALAVDGEDGAALAAGIGRLVGDAGLRAALAAAGRVRARAFTIEAFAARLDTLYADVLASLP